jgi:hypothetical protein
MYAAVKTVATVLSLSFFIDRLGRRKLLLTSSVGTSLALWYIGAFVTVKHIGLSIRQEKSVAGWVAIVCVYVYAVSFVAQFLAEKTRFKIEEANEALNRHSFLLPGMAWYGFTARRFSQSASKNSQSVSARQCNGFLSLQLLAPLHPCLPIGKEVSFSSLLVV